MPSPIRPLAALFAALALVATACGSGSSAEATAPNGAGSDTSSEHDAVQVAESNIDDLAPNDDVRLLEILDVETGTATTIADTVTGDRPVLLWFWAPH